MPHYYSEKQDSALKLRKVVEVIRGSELKFFFASGVFSSKKVDKGSLLLAECAIVENNWRVLDLGCGNGVIGIAIAKAFPKAKVVMSDVNERAVKTAMMNCKLNRTPCVVLQGNGFDKIEGLFDAILLNPPQTAGKDVCTKLIEESKAHLNKGGLLQLVARHNKGGKSLNNFMNDVFKNTIVLKKSGGYRVYASKNG
jgi:16S rRNA G1207 methylase RsmC